MRINDDVTQASFNLFAPVKTVHLHASCFKSAQPNALAPLFSLVFTDWESAMATVDCSARPMSGTHLVTQLVMNRLPNPFSHPFSEVTIRKCCRAVDRAASSPTDSHCVARKKSHRWSLDSLSWFYSSRRLLCKQDLYDPSWVGKYKAETLFSSLASKNSLLFQVRRNAEAFNKGCYCTISDFGMFQFLNNSYYYYEAWCVKPPNGIRGI